MTTHWPATVRSLPRSSTRLTYTHHAALWSGHLSSSEAAEHVRRTLCLDEVTGLAGSTHFDLTDGSIPVRWTIYTDPGKGAVFAIFPLDQADLPALLADLEAILQVGAAPERLGSSEGVATVTQPTDPRNEFLSCREGREESKRERQSRRAHDAPAAAIALGASLLSLLVPAALWSFKPTVSDATVVGFMVICVIGCCAALVGFIVGVMGSHHPLGVVAIILSVPGGLASLVTLGILFMALALADGGAFVGTP